jgi:hypothetical protein
MATSISKGGTAQWPRFMASVSHSGSELCATRSVLQIV